MIGATALDHRSMIAMTPTLFRDGSFRYFFFSREETRMHVHVSHPDGEAKFWLEPVVELASNKGLSARQLRAAQQFVELHQGEMRNVWQKWFSTQPGR